MFNKIDEKAAELRDQLISEIPEELKDDLGEIELRVTTGYTLADAIREGSRVSEQEVGGWGEGDTACALSAAVIAAKGRGYL